MRAMGITVVLVYGSAGDGSAFAEGSSSSNNQAAVITSAAKQCPTDASIPEALAQADGLAQQIVFLKQELVRQEQERAHAEKVAREGLTDPSQELKPCRHGKEEAYCYAVDQYLVSTAANLANQAFLEALQCYYREGVR
jgi:hypothetical protein